MVASSSPSFYLNLITRTRLTISLRQLRLNSHSDHASFSDNLLLVGLVNVAGQSGDEQSGQDGQDDQNDDQLDEGEALLSFSF